jgi:hypothetical protein
VYEAQPWNPPYVDSDGITSRNRDILFKLHANCSLKANEKFLKKDWHPSIFHFTWMEMTSGEVAHKLSPTWKKWKKGDVRGSVEEDMKIGTVAASVSGV